ncbi:Ribosome biogenesis protein ytm1 [Fulvia fulva]|uniref:Ribosome biogenesis protein YTM1 n=1 Tax=Passalora fulva TaxID=5499 RepID=A0A9Q8PI06_PASFU|nr:Ribosome biogenesis protein ytm1 [Fulvia fulva]KAK4616820.1 Ribosome biogenesis protein ytm1 [Fulvia fulva]UJO22787.1 Ribosome biogenesis protein ytm1 [Fulvia fulva]WPV19753.1 Ribosome biogenesis protein ytm1 [Fulvia fulva]
MAADNTAQVRIQLRTKDSDIELPETGEILVSTDLKRYQLSTLVNRLLDTEKPVPLEFLINGQFLRTSLDDYLTQNGISAETTLSVEYVKALVPPTHVASYEHDDWVSCVDVLSQGPQSRILSGSFDGSLSIWNMSSNKVATGQWHKARVNSAAFVSKTEVASAGVDRSLVIWDLKDAETGQGTLKPKLELLGHQSSIESLAVSASTSRILTASADGRIGLWSTKKSEGTTAPEVVAPSNKRRKLSGPEVTIPQRGALGMLEGHRDQVKDIVFDEKDHTVAYSASQDHTVKTWDLTTNRSVDTRTTAQSLTSLLHLPEQSLIAAGGTQRYIDLVDPREGATKVSAMQLRGHQGIVNSLAQNPELSYQIVSASNDGTCRIWDLRAGSNEATGDRVGSSVFVIERDSQRGKKADQGDASRVFSVCWDREVGIVSGGRDKMLQINKGS